MPRLDLSREAVSIGVGALDEGIEAMDRQQGFTRPFQNLTDWYRVLVGSLSAFGYVSNMAPNVTEPALHAASALAVKSVSRIVRQGLFSTAGFRSVLPAAQRVALRGGPQAVERVRSTSGEEVQVIVI